MSSGNLALLLHAHLPFVRHPEHESFLEEDWLFESIAETYLPLLKVFHRLANEAVPFRLTMTLTPSLCAMLRDPMLRQRAEQYLARGAALAEAEMTRHAGDPHLRQLAEFHHARFSEMLRYYTEVVRRDIVGAFAQLQSEGFIEIITCGATHGFLPLMEEFPEAIRAQILIGCDYHRECFSKDPVGIWLPECGYIPGIDSALQKANLRWFVIDAHGLLFGNPRPRFAMFAPCFTASGPAAFARDRESSRQVWSAEEGYPGDPAYRDFYRDIGQELPEDYLRPFTPPGPRRNTGIKYHRITGPGRTKEYYVRGWAEAAADAHAADFLENRKRQIAHLRQVMGIEPIVVSPFDAELFGHWWFEGPEFIEFFLRKACFDQDVFRLVTPTDYLAQCPVAQVVSPSPSSWGHKGYWEVWLDRSNAWIYPHLHEAARRMIVAAKRFAGKSPSARQERLLKQLARELLLAQSSDWAFLMKTGTARHYAERRTRDHILRFNRLHDELEGKGKGESILALCEERDNLFADLNWRHYA